MLLHPTHRKFITLLRSYTDNGTIINISEHDKKRFSDLIDRTDNALERHKVIYKLILEILHRNTPVEEGYPFTHEIVDIIELHLTHAERRKPCNTLRGTLIQLLRLQSHKLTKCEK